MTSPSALLRPSKETLRYSRERFLGTWLALSLLALLAGLALWLSIDTAREQDDQTEEVAMQASETADGAQQSSEEIVSYMQGDSGLPGVPGEDGQEGEPGLPSSEPGPQGEPGEQGEPGTPGAAGTAGPMGVAGTAGSPGPAGPAGPVGPRGPQGPRGEGERGAQGARGPQGPQGAQGPPGGTGPPGQTTTSIAIGQTANDPNTPKSATATCPAGRATGGGFALVPSDPGLIVTASSPVGNTGWNVTVEELSFPAADSWQAFVFVTCLG